MRHGLLFFTNNGYFIISNNISESVVLKLLHSVANRLRARWVWSRGKRYFVIAKLDPVKIVWIIRQKQQGVETAIIAAQMNVSTRWVYYYLWRQYRTTSAIPSSKKPGRPRKEITKITEIQIQEVVVEAFTKYKLGGVCLEKIIDSHFLMHIYHITQYITY